MIRHRLLRIAAIAFGLLVCSALPVLAWDKDSLARLQPLAEQGNAEAQYYVGMLYHMGIGGASRDTKTAFDWFQKAASGDDPFGAYKVGCYYAGQNPGVVAIDEEKALNYKLVAAKAGYALAQSDVAGTYYQRGEFAEAEKWWVLAAEQGYPPAASNLSVLYFDGKTGTRDVVKAYTWFKIVYASGRIKMNDKAQEFLDKVTRDMTSTEIAKADRQVRRWKPQPNPVTVRIMDPKSRVEALLAKLTSPPNQ